MKLFAILIPLFITCTGNLCSKCVYTGGLRKALHTHKEEYKFCNMQLGEMLYSMEIEKCSVSHTKLKLRGVILAPVPLNTPHKGISVLKAIAKGNILMVEDTLAISNNKGVFVLNTNLAENTYIIIRQNDTIGIVYSLAPSSFSLQEK